VARPDKKDKLKISFEFKKASEAEIRSRLEQALNILLPEKLIFDVLNKKKGGVDNLQLTKHFKK